MEIGLYIKAMSIVLSFVIKIMMACSLSLVAFVVIFLIALEVENKTKKENFITKWFNIRF